MAADTNLTQLVSGALSALIGDADVTDVLAHLVRDCADVLEADSVAILARDDDGELALLSASSHGAVELELQQIQRSAGPCIDVLDSNEALSVVGADQIRARWPEVGRAITDAGYVGVEAFPLRWRGTILGGLNVFRTSESTVGNDVALGQALADIATLAVVCSLPVTTDQAVAQLQEALNARELIEQAKGFIAQVETVDLGTAYDLLVRRAETSGETLTRAAASVIEQRTHHSG